MATPRAQGLFAEAQALVDAASVIGDAALSAQAQKVQQDVVSYNVSPWPSWLLTNPQADVDALAMQIQTSTGVNPLDVDSDANLTPDGAGSSVSDFDKTVLGGGGYGAAVGGEAGKAADAAGKAISSLLTDIVIIALLVGAVLALIELGGVKGARAKLVG